MSGDSRSRRLNRSRGRSVFPRLECPAFKIHTSMGRRRSIFPGFFSLRLFSRASTPLILESSFLTFQRFTDRIKNWNRHPPPPRWIKIVCIPRIGTIYKCRWSFRVEIVVNVVMTRMFRRSHRRVNYACMYVCGTCYYVLERDDTFCISSSLLFHKKIMCRALPLWLRSVSNSENVNRKSHLYTFDFF